MFLSSWQISSKLPNTESDFSNIAGVASQKLLSVLDIFLRILQEFRIASATFCQIKLNGFDLKSPLKSAKLFTINNNHFEAAC